MYTTHTNWILTHHSLDSRQRKKQHTERLEDEKKHYTNVMSDMEQTINDLRTEVAELQMEKESLVHYANNLSIDKDEIIRQHTIETTELRKKVSVMSDHIQALEASVSVSLTSLASVPEEAQTGACNSGIGTYDNIGDLGMEAGSDPWEDVYHNTPSIEQSQQITVHKADPKSRNVEAAACPAIAQTEKPSSQGGLLFMLFLVGAFVMSNRQMPGMLPVSDEIRVASAELLDNVLRDAGMPNSLPSVSLQPLAVVASTSTQVKSDAASATLWSQPATVEPSLLGQLSEELIHTTEEQAKTQLFSLNAAQYSGIVGSQLPSPAPDSATITSNQDHHNLADTLDKMRNNSRADVYTRTLLWDQIPSEVVRSFIKMVSEINTATFNIGGKQ